MNRRSPWQWIWFTVNEHILSSRVTGRTRRVGSIHLAMTGIITIAVGALALTGALLNRLTPFLLQLAPRFTSEATLLSLGGYLPGLRAAIEVAAVLYILIGVLQIGVARALYQGDHQTTAIRATIAGFLNPVAVPLAAIALVLILLYSNLDPQSTTGNSS